MEQLTLISSEQVDNRRTEERVVQVVVEESFRRDQAEYKGCQITIESHRGLKRLMSSDVSRNVGISYGFGMEPGICTVFLYDGVFPVYVGPNSNNLAKTSKIDKATQWALDYIVSGTLPDEE